MSSQHPCELREKNVRSDCVWWLDWTNRSSVMLGAFHPIPFKVKTRKSLMKLFSEKRPTTFELRIYLWKDVSKCLAKLPSPVPALVNLNTLWHSLTLVMSHCFSHRNVTVTDLIIDSSGDLETPHSPPLLLPFLLLLLSFFFLSPPLSSPPPITAETF